MADPTYASFSPSIADLSDNQLSSIRNRRIGFIFQSFNLVPQLTVLENVEVPLFYGMSTGVSPVERCRELLDTIGLSHRLKHRPPQLSGGERQRVAIARALVNDPSLVLADEPTGNLDTETGDEILELLREFNAEGTTVVIVTHDPRIGEQARRTLSIRDGRIERDEARS